MTEHYDLEDFIDAVNELSAVFFFLNLSISSVQCLILSSLFEIIFYFNRNC